MIDGTPKFFKLIFPKQTSRSYEGFWSILTSTNSMGDIKGSSLFNIDHHLCFLSLLSHFTFFACKNNLFKNSTKEFFLKKFNSIPLIFTCKIIFSEIQQKDFKKQNSRKIQFIKKSKFQKESFSKTQKDF